MTAICAACDHVCAETRKATPYRWRCLKHPRQLEADPRLLFVDPRYVVDPPYSLCMNVNQLGECPDFQARRTPPGEQA